MRHVKLLAVAAVLGNLYPLVVVVIAAVVLGERLARVQVAGTAVGLAGVLLLSG